MNSTRLGKIFVLVNLSFSLLLAGLALGIATNRIDWSGTGKALPGEVAQGELARRKADLRREGELAWTATAPWKEQGIALRDAEKQRLENQDWYAAQLDILRGKDRKGNPVNAPITALVYEPAGLKLDDKTGRPVLEPVADKPLKSYEALQQDLREVKKKISDALEQIDALVKQQADLTLEIDGEKGKMRGLRDLIAEEEQVQHRAVAETAAVQPVRVNREVEAELLKKRRVSLQSRIEELNTAGLATRQP